MKNITIQLKQKHLGYCATFMMQGSMAQYFYIANTVRTQLLAGTYGAEDLISINVAPSDLVTIYRELGYRPERTSSAMNGDMKLTLLPQLQTLATSSDADIVESTNYVIAQLTQIDTDNQTEIQAVIDTGIVWLTQ